MRQNRNQRTLHYWLNYINDKRIDKYVEDMYKEHEDYLAFKTAQYSLRKLEEERAYVLGESTIDYETYLYK